MRVMEVFNDKDSVQIWGVWLIINGKIIELGVKYRRRMVVEFKMKNFILDMSVRCLQVI